MPLYVLKKAYSMWSLGSCILFAMIQTDLPSVSQEKNVHLAFLRKEYERVAKTNRVFSK